MATPQPQSGDQPKIVQTLLRRTLVVLVVFAVLFGGLRWMQSRNGDYDNGGTSLGMIAAIRLEANGQQAVLIQPDGSVVGTKSWKDGVTDREPVWAPDGKFLFFCSDRKDSTFNVFRWNPQSDDAQVRTEKGGSRSNPTFAPGDTEGKPLIVNGGIVRELDPTTGKSPQVLPAVNAEIVQSGSGTEEGQGMEGSMSVYGALGKSFRVARYLPGKSAIVAVLRRDEGESLIMQSMVPNESGKMPGPVPIVAGDHVDFDLDPTTGAVVFSVQNFRVIDKDHVPQEYRQGNRIVLPLRNGVGIVDPVHRQLTYVRRTNDDAHAFGSPRVSPDGSRLGFVQGHVEDGSLVPQELLIVPYGASGNQTPDVHVAGDIYEPSWSPDAKTLIYAKRVAGKRDLFTVGVDGAGEKDLTNGKGDYMTPLFSPQQKP